MTRLRMMMNRTSWVWLWIAAASTGAALVACGGPTPIPGSSSLTNAGRRSGSGAGINLTPNGSGTNPGSSGAVTDVSEVDGGNCGITTNSLTQQPADLLLVLDRSASMSYDIASNTPCTGGFTGACTARWPTMTTSVNQVLAASPAGVQWGLKFFTSPGGQTCTVNAGADVAVGPNTAAQIQAAISGTSPGNQTPTTAAINAAVAYLNTVNDSRSHFMLLATDGQPNCDPGTSASVTDTSVANTVAAITAAAGAGIKTYVIGIGPSTGNLDNFAVAGGTGKYFPALSPQDLTNALSSIVGSVASCTFSLGKTPPDPGNIVIEFDGDKSLRAPRDTTHTNGWDYTSSADNVIQIFGSWCEKVTNGTYKSAKVLMGCPGNSVPIP